MSFEEDFPVEHVPLDQIRPHPRNYRVHPKDQLDHLVESITRHGIYKPIVTAQDGTILAGHGVALAAHSMGIDAVPIRRLPLHPDDPQALKILAGDNEIARLGEVDDKMLAEILRQVKAEDSTGLMGTGFDDKSFSALLLNMSPVADGEEPKGEAYTTKIEVPTYNPSNVKPNVPELFDDEKTKKLMDRIVNAKGITEDERHFLIVAAQRHTVLHFNLIADFYAHSNETVQSLMEESALVIVDFDRAVELGFVQLTKRLAAMVEDDYGD